LPEGRGFLGKAVQMATLTFTANEIEVMRLIMDTYKQELLFEIARTDSRDLKAYLREREILIENIMDRLARVVGELETTDAPV
jgi:hypothetical protein